MLAHRLRRWPNISPVLSYRVVFGVMLNVGQRHRRRANINPAVSKYRAGIVYATQAYHWPGNVSG